uniref:Energy-coupling factor transporter ATP-binding protein EcfA3 n=1 Tax=Mycoplasma feriruminatoris TaxID=1179777 RepID=A0A654IC96_9MOLU|nr:Energy-coupling factor transporter ATP-binding protein EcfA3 [Mycoplasma feriruminatoris]VZR75529.1 Energy-coupling factor transporter ATP-binding protein EcfA3 [Mycoplasma feriruminatoris]VZR97941.1 Energy-coupling factor transporter ATP-binding protein EcfA3 [Mycoplasma feriruminatoris]
MVGNVSKKLQVDLSNEKYSVVVDNFYKKFKDIEIGPFSFNIEKGKITALLGSSGSGKSVFINSLLRTSINYQGSIFINQKERKNNDSIQNNSDIGFYSQMDFSLYSISAYDFLYNMCYVMGLENKLVKQKLEYWLKKFDLWEAKDKPLKSFSWGMKNRINLILCFIKEPKILVCDEPGANLDSYWRKQIYTILDEFKKNSNSTIILTVHNIDEVYDIIQNFIILEKGKLLFSGSKQELNLYKKTKITFEYNILLEQVEKILNQNDILTFNLDTNNNSLVIGLKEYQSISDALDVLKKHNLYVKSLDTLSIDIDMIKKALEDKITKHIPKYQKNSMNSLQKNLEYNNQFSFNKTTNDISNITNCPDTTSNNEVEIINNNNNNNLPVNNLFNDLLQKTFLNMFDEIKNLKQQVNQNNLDNYENILDDLKTQISSVLEIKNDFLEKIDELKEQNDTFINSDSQNINNVLDLKDFINKQSNKIQQTLFKQLKNMNNPSKLNNHSNSFKNSDLSDEYLELKSQLEMLKSQINHNSITNNSLENQELNRLKSDILTQKQELEQFKKELYFEKMLNEKLNSFDNKLKERESILELERLKQEIKEEQNKLRELMFLEKLTK